MHTQQLHDPRCVEMYVQEPVSKQWVTDCNSKTLQLRNDWIDLVNHLPIWYPMWCFSCPCSKHSLMASSPPYYIVLFSLCAKISMVQLVRGRILHWNLPKVMFRRKYTSFAQKKRSLRQSDVCVTWMRTSIAWGGSTCTSCTINSPFGFHATAASQCTRLN